MTDLEIVLTAYVVFLQIMFFALLALQRSINKAVKTTLEILLRRSK